jgi:hypothetical protein
LENIVNTNMIHNILNVLILISGVAAGFDWSVLAAFGISAAFAAKLTAFFAGLKLTINAIRDGFAGLVKDQPPVQP